MVISALTKRDNQVFDIDLHGLKQSEYPRPTIGRHYETNANIPITQHMSLTGRGVVVMAAALGCESYPSSSTRRARRTCDRGPRDDRGAATQPPAANGVHNGLRGATVSRKNRLRIVAAAKAASPPDGLDHHPQRGVRHPRPRTHPPRSNHRIRRCPSPLRTSWYPRGRAWGRMRPCSCPVRALQRSRVAFPPCDDT